VASTVLAAALFALPPRPSRLCPNAAPMLPSRSQPRYCLPRPVWGTWGAVGRQRVCRACADHKAVSGSSYSPPMAALRRSLARAVCLLEERA